MTLEERFLAPPFSIIDGKQGYFRKRENYWRTILEDAENHRGRTLKLDKEVEEREVKNLGYYFGGEKGLIKGSTRSVFPVSIFSNFLCELIYKWFNVKNGKILDPFAGGLNRGCMASLLGFEYFGNDLNKEQINRNISFVENNPIFKLKPLWVSDDSVNIQTLVPPNIKYDLLFTCPPYFNLEQYTKDERDISNMNYSDFSIVYEQILKNSMDLLNDNRFAVVVIANIRDKNGFYYDLVGLTNSIMSRINNCGLYNDMIYATPIGSGSVRATGQFKANMKVVKTHQNILVYYKGDLNEIQNIKNLSEHFNLKVQRENKNKLPIMEEE